MKHIIIYIICFCFMILHLTGCTEFLSADISNKTLSINSPSDTLFTAGSVTFWWEDEPQAENYRLQIVSPFFANPTYFKDTLVTNSNLKLSLNEGVYEWRVRMENESSKSNYQMRSFIVDKTPPAQATAFFPQDLDTLTQSQIVLNWKSQDNPIQQNVFPVKDSVFLYEVAGSDQILRAEYFRDFTQDTKWDVSIYISTSTDYLWKVKSIDKSGNSKLSGGFRFRIQ